MKRAWLLARVSTTKSSQDSSPENQLTTLRAYCERKGIPYQVIEPKEPVRRPAAYADNFAFRRNEPWTH